MKNNFAKIWVVTLILMAIIETGLGRAGRPAITTNFHAANVPWHRPDATGWILLAIAFIVGSFAFTHVFLEGYRGRGWVEGLRFGIWVTLLVSVTESLSYAAVLPIGRRLPTAFIIGDLITFVICGIVAAALAGTTQASSAASAG